MPQDTGRVTLGLEPGMARPPHATELAAGRRSGLVYLVLCVLVLSAGLVDLGSAIWNVQIMLLHELAFMVVYVALLRPPIDLAHGLKHGSVVYWTGVLWVLSVTIALVWSPLGTGAEPLGQLRYLQTLLHVMFFLVLRDFLIRHPAPLGWVVLAIPASGLLVALGMSYQLFQLETYDAAASYRWFNDPPLNGHIRYAGYQITAAIAASIAFFLSAGRVPLGRMPLFVGLVALCTLLFWIGGRGAIISVVAAFACLALVAALKGLRGHRIWLAFWTAMAIGIALAELAAVFPWNGVISAVTRTVDAADLTQASSDRLILWQEAWESVRGHLAFGLGPQGYFFMPNRSFGLQPHSMPLQFVVEWGVIGSLLFLSMLAYGFWRGFVSHVVRASADMNLAALSAGSIIVALTVHGLVDGTYYHPQPSFYLAVAFAIWTLPRRAEGKNRR